MAHFALRNSRLSPVTATKPTTNIYSLSCLRNEVFQTVPFDASSDANEPLIAHGDAVEEDHRLEEKIFSRFKFSYVASWDCLWVSLVSFPPWE
jgi:hypothetical protein